MISETLLLQHFIAKCREIPSPRVLETGAFRSQPDRSTLHKQWVPHASAFVGTDFRSGPDVDLTADLHTLANKAGTETFDIVISCATLEHVKYPHLAALNMLKVLKVNGLIFIHTHQTFPLHAYPNDYYRFSREALQSLFSSAMGVQAETCYEYPAQIHTERDPQCHMHPAFLNVLLSGRKVAPTPYAFVCEGI